MERLTTMRRVGRHFSGLALAILLAGCSSMEDWFDEPIEPEPMAATAPEPVAAPAPESARPLARIGNDGPPQVLPPVPVTQPPGGAASAPGSLPLGTSGQAIAAEVAAVDHSVRAYHGQFEQSRAAARALDDQFHGIVAGLTARLQAGTTPGNPLLTQQLADAQARLTEIGNSTIRLEELRGEVAADQAHAGLLADRVRTADGSARMPADERRQLASSTDEVAAIASRANRLLGDIDADTDRRNAYVIRQRRNLTTLGMAVRNGEIVGPGLYSEPQPSPASPPAPQTAAPSAAPPEAAAGGASGQREPMLVIDFSSADATYEAALYDAVSDAVARRPAAGFRVVAVSPEGLPPGSAREKAGRVMRSLKSMGVPEARLSQGVETRAGATADQVHVYAL